MLNSNYDVTQVVIENYEHVVCAQVISSNDEFFLISAYFQYSHEVDPYLNVIDKILNNIQAKYKKIIIGADVNANSPTWFSSGTDERGEKIDEFILAKNLVL